MDMLEKTHKVTHDDVNHNFIVHELKDGKDIVFQKSVTGLWFYIPEETAQHFQLLSQKDEIAIGSGRKYEVLFTPTNR
jgi:hypothetical protein